MNFLNKENLNKLFEKCTIAVNAIASCTEKNKQKKGVRIVPNPKPEKNVIIAATNATKATKTNNILFLQFN